MAPAYQYSSKYKKFNQNYITKKKLEGGCWRPQAKAFQKTKKNLNKMPLWERTLHTSS